MSKCFHCHRAAVPGHSLCHRHIESSKASPAASQDKAHPTPAVAVPSGELLPCPFCGQTCAAPQVGETYRWRVVVCGCGARGPDARISATPSNADDGNRHAVAMWNNRATPPSLPAAQAVEEAEGARQVVEVYDKLHEGKIGQHWLWAVIEQIAAGVPEDEVLKSFGYYEKQEPCFHRPACEECAEDRALAGGAAK